MAGLIGEHQCGLRGGGAVPGEIAHHALDESACADGDAVVVEVVFLHRVAERERRGSVARRQIRSAPLRPDLDLELEIRLVVGRHGFREVHTDLDVVA